MITESQNQRSNKNKEPSQPNKVGDRLKVLCIDMDGTLCLEECWTEEQCANATPRQDVIDFINSIENRYIVIVYTARTDKLMSQTFKWLHDHGVRFRAVSNNKIGSDIYIDDKALHVDDFLKEKEAF